MKRVKDLSTTDIQLLFAVAFLFLCLSVNRLDAFSEPVQADFDWSMPDRYGLDENGDGRIDLITEDWTDSQAIRDFLNPESWTVHFTACGTTGDATSFAWTIDGELIDESFECNGFSYDFPGEDTYTVRLDVTGEDGQVSTIERQVVVQDWLIIGIGDSYGAGVGSADTNVIDQQLAEYAELLDFLPDADDLLAGATEAYDAIKDDLDFWKAKQSDLAGLVNAINSAAADVDRKCFSFPPSLDCPAATVRLATATSNFVSFLVDCGLEFIGENTRQAITYFSSLIADLNFDLATALDALEAAQNGVDGVLAAIDLLESDIGCANGGEHCPHRVYSAQSVAALSLERAETHTSVTFVHVAVSGATVSDVAGQLERARNLVGDREVDALVTSIGGNDAGFADILASCVARQDCHLDNSQLDAFVGPILEAQCALLPASLQDDCVAVIDFATSLGDATEIFETGLATLPGSYSDMASEIQQAFPEMPSKRVFLTEYPDTTKSESGSYCEPDVDDLLGTAPGIELSEWQWLDQVVTGEINAAVRTASAEHGWNLIDGIHDMSRNHGYCADDRWTLRFADSAIIGTLDMVHPTRNGHAAFADVIAADLGRDFYPDGEPREPGTTGAEASFIRGDVNGDGSLNIADPSFIANFLFGIAPATPPACTAAADVNGDGGLNVADPSYAANFVFGIGTAAPPPAPFPGCGTSNDDALPCDVSSDACTD